MKISKTPCDIACDLAKEYPTSHDLNEANTRHRLIDTVLHDVLSWPRSSVECESFINPGYADYVLLGRQGRQIVFIEAKREGAYFNLPINLAPNPYRVIKVKTLLTDPVVCTAMEQVRNYCLNSGCEYAAVTNGHQWIFFKTFERQFDWRQVDAFVILDLTYFSEHFVDATNKLGYSSITERASLQQLLGAHHAHHIDVFYPKTKIAAYNQEVTSNYLAPLLRPLAERYLGRMNEHDAEFLERCYVNMREYQASVVGVNEVIYDCLSPYFKNYNVKEFFDDSKGGAFGGRISSSLRERRTREVIILFGGKGSGKSTFIRKLLYHRPPLSIKNFAVVAVIDLLECPEDRVHIENQIWTQLIEKIDSDRILHSDRDGILSLFADRYELAQRQFLAGLDARSEAYNINLNSLVSAWLADREYCAMRLADYWKKKQKGLIVVLDNTDQFSPSIQDYCFTLAHHVSTQLDCLVVISMREERFHYSKLHGTLDAFQNSGFHLSSPPPQVVFYRRLRYLLEILDNPDRARKISPNLTDWQVEDIKQLLRVLLGEFRRRSSHLNQFLRACAHGNMRLSLDFFRQFLLSGYTRVDEMIKPGGWTLQIHQVLRPMMVPYRFFYDEESSNIPNIYQIRSETSGSHFTSLRVLSLLSANMSPKNPAYVPLSHLKGYFASNFNMLDDLAKNLDVLLRTGIIESNNRVDEYTESIDSLKITPYGFYMVDTLWCMFNYLDLVSLDCAIHEESVAHSLALLADRDIALFNQRKRLERVQVRLQRVQEFVDYLQREEERERELYSLAGTDFKYTQIIKERFASEKDQVLASAQKNYGKFPSVG